MSRIREAAAAPARERGIAEPLARIEARWEGEPVVAGITTGPHDFRAGAGGVAGGSAGSRRRLRDWAEGRFRILVGSVQVHGSRIFRADGVAVPGARAEDAPAILRLAGYDGFAVGELGTLLTVGVADCVPAALWAPDAGAAAILHAGWRGVAGEILPRAVETLEEEYGADPARLLAWWGPSIGVDCYPVGEEVVAAIGETAAGAEEGRWVRTGPDASLRVDLSAALTLQAVAAGVREERVTVSPLCTACEEGLLHSYRRDAGAAGRMLAFVGVEGG
ncbi:MAG: polyphenol oxidase family protein [Gemmatimonadota bacterium]|nr:polyphenol oxidase family protein [Gemmatimonadota bacterium]